MRPVRERTGTNGALALVLCMFVSCQKAEVTNYPKPEQSPSPSIPQDTLITLERTGCYGRCPSYKLIIFGDGIIIYDGETSVKTKGVVRGTVSQDQLKQLISEFEKVDYFSLKDKYEVVGDGCFTYGTDAHHVNTTFRINGKSKSIRHYYGCLRKVEQGNKVLSAEEEVYPQELVALERKIDEIVNSRQWVGEPYGES